MTDTATPAVAGWPRIVLQLEGAALLAAATILYARTDASWWLYFILFLAPDLCMFGYLFGARAGAVAYNIVHSTIGPLALGVVGVAGVLPPLALPLALTWGAHIGLDRAMGLGLKYGTGIKATHLSRTRVASA